MAMQRETGKDRWKRVPKDYFKKPVKLSLIYIGTHDHMFCIKIYFSKFSC